MFRLGQFKQLLETIPRRQAIPAVSSGIEHQLFLQISLVQKILEDSERFRTDMVFDAFCIGTCRSWRYAQRLKKCDDRFMANFRIFRELSS